MKTCDLVSGKVPIILCMCAKSLQLYLTFCHPSDCSPPGSSVQGILQARILEYVAVPSSRGSFWPRDQICISYIFCWLPCGSAGNESTCNAGDLGSIPGLGRPPGEGKGDPLQYPGLENFMDYIVHEVAKSQTWLSNFHFTSSCLLHWQAGSLPLAPPGKPKFYLFIWQCQVFKLQHAKS